MKKNFLTVVALSVAAFFVATEIAVAADISFSGQLRTRWEYNEQGTNATNTTRKFLNDADGDDSISTRMRTNIKVQRQRQHLCFHPDAKHEGLGWKLWYRWCLCWFRQRFTNSE